jgi:hypothetical protein
VTGVDAFFEETGVDVFFDETGTVVFFDEMGLIGPSEEMDTDALFEETEVDDLFDETETGFFVDDAFFDMTGIVGFFSETLGVVTTFDELDLEIPFAETEVAEILDKTGIGAGDAIVAEMADNKRRKEVGKSIFVIFADNQ